LKAAEKGTPSVEQCRRFFAQEIRAVTGIPDELVKAFSRVPRERFLGMAPWFVAPAISLYRSDFRSTTDPRDLYHDVLVALKREQAINNGQPTLLARLIGALNLRRCGRVLHVGCGTGYYTAIMAEVVGPAGSVLAVDLELDLATRAASNLDNYPCVTVIHQDAAELALGPRGLCNLDAILVNATVTHPHAGWLQCLRDGGVIVLPLAVGKDAAANDAFAIAIERKSKKFLARPVYSLSLYPSPSLRDPLLQAQLHQCFEAHTILGLKSVRTDDHPRADTCLAHSPGFCLSSAQAIDVP
jgi:protein-L-isoaspartate(D-aspartate) O-methyltransferase